MMYDLISRPVSVLWWSDRNHRNISQFCVGFEVITAGARNSPLSWERTPCNRFNLLYRFISLVRFVCKMQSNEVNYGI
jgi:hypothetical protein